MALAKKLNINLKEFNICGAFRLQSNRRSNETQSITVKLNNTKSKSKLIREVGHQKLTSKKLGYDENVNIYIDNHRLRETTGILKKAKLLSNEGNILSTWTFNGNVFVRKNGR